MLRTKIIATHITTLTDARYFAAWGVDYLAYITDSNRDDAVSLEALKEIDQWVEGPETLLMYEGISIDSESATFRNAGYTRSILGPYIEDDGAWKEVFRVVTSLDDIDTAGRYIYRPEGMVPYTADVEPGVHIYLDAHLSLESLIEASSYEYITGIVVRGSDEQKIGVKSFDELTDFFEAIEV